MFTQVLRKSLILLATYAFIIIGIFVFQFKNDSIISEKIGSLHITLLESTAEDNSISLKNKFTFMFNGITFSGNDEKPVIAQINGKKTPLSLVSWKKLSPLSCEFAFNHGIKLLCSVSDETSKAYLLIDATLPKGVERISLPYGLSAGSTITNQADSKLRLSNKKNSWELAASDVESDKIVFTKKEHSASYAFFDSSRAFSFEMVASLDSANETNYINTIENFKSNLISSFAQVPADSSTVAEQEAVSYVAAMAERGKYNEALDAVPQAFKKSSSRTFLSGPYFDTLVKVNETLQRTLLGIADFIKTCNENGSIEAMGTPFVADYMCMHPGAESVQALLKNAAAMDYAESSMQIVAAVLNVYNELYEKDISLAQILKPAAQKCVEKIQNSCAVDNGNITLSERGTFLSVVQAVSAGDALYRYGLGVQNESYISAGRLIINSYLKESSSFDLKTLSDLYPIIVHKNNFYPHFEILSFDNGRAVWAFTCAENISYKNDNAGTVTLTIDFPLSYTHYVIIDGIERFQSIYIYDLAFRTDFRFETYNSSGYVYQRDTSTLLLKSRHKSQLETIRLVYNVQKEDTAIKETVSE